MSRTPGIYEQIDEVEYHGDPALSQSGAKLLLNSPAHYRQEMDNRTDARHFDVGHAVHTLILGTGANVETIALASRRSKAWDEHEAACRASGSIPMTEDEYADVAAMAEAVLAHHEARSLFEREGVSELSMWWEETAAIGFEQVPVMCRGRIDRLTAHDGAPLAVDLKTTTKSSAPIGWRSTVLDYGYDIQAAAYHRGYLATAGDPLPMVHVVVEKAKPHVVAVYEPMPADYFERGERRWLDAVQTFAQCTADNEWPGRPGISTYPPLPAWAS